MTEAERKAFDIRVKKAAEAFELSGWTPQQARKKAIEAVQAEDRATKDAEIATLRRALDGQGDY